MTSTTAFPAGLKWWATCSSDVGREFPAVRGDGARIVNQYMENHVVLGLPSLGWGESITACGGVPVHDADATVHRLYEGDAVAPSAAPRHHRRGQVDRIQPGAHLATPRRSPGEAIVHPPVRRAAVAGAGAGGGWLRARHPAAVRDRRRSSSCGGGVGTARCSARACRCPAPSRFEDPGLKQMLHAARRADFVVDTPRVSEGAQCVRPCRVAKMPGGDVIHICSLRGEEKRMRVVLDTETTGLRPWPGHA